MDDTSQPPAPPVLEEDEVVTPIIQQRALAAVEGEQAELVDDDGPLDFDIGPLQVMHRAEMGPGPRGRLVPYIKYGFGVPMSPRVSIVSGDGQRMAIMVPLPPSGAMKMSDLKKLANKLWREARQQKMDD